MIEVPAWITEIYCLSNAQDIEQALDVVINNFDDLFCQHQFLLADEIIQQLDFSLLHPDIVVGILTFAYPARNNLPCWQKLKANVADYLSRFDTPEEISELMKDLT